MLKHPLPFASFLAAICILGAKPPFAGCQDKAAAPVEKVLGKAKDAFVNMRTTLQSGKGKGTFRQETESGLICLQSGKITSYIKDGRYHVQLDYDDPKESGVFRKIIIHDGSEFLFSSSFWKPTRGGVKSEGYVYRNVAARPPTEAGFHWNLAKPWLVDMDKLLKNVPASKFKAKSLGEKGYELRYDVGTAGSFAVLECREKDGWNISKCVSYRDAETPPFQIFEATWAKQKGQWYVNGLTYQIDTRFRGGSLSRWKMTYESFEANCAVSDELFTIDGLNLESGSRILDFVPNQTTAEYKYQKAK